MPRVKLTLLLSSLLLIQMWTIEAQKINLIRINSCLQASLELTSALALKAVPVIKEIITCVNYQYKVNTDSLKATQLIMLIYQFMIHAMNNRINCLMNAYLELTAIASPNLEKMRSLKCRYLLVKEPLC